MFSLVVSLAFAGGPVMDASISEFKIKVETRFAAVESRLAALEKKGESLQGTVSVAKATDVPLTKVRMKTVMRTTMQQTCSNGVCRMVPVQTAVQVPVSDFDPYPDDVTPGPGPEPDPGFIDEEPRRCKLFGGFFSGVGRAIFKGKGKRGGGCCN